MENGLSNSSKLSLKISLRSPKRNLKTNPALELESCSNPLRIQQVLQSKSKKKFFVFGGERHKWGCFWLPGPGLQPIGPLLWLKTFSETRPKSASLEPLNDFLAYLQPKSWPKKTKLVKISAPTNPNLGWTPFLNGHHTPADRARELFKSALNGERLVVQPEKKTFRCAISAFLAMFTKPQVVLTGFSEQSVTSAACGSA